MKRTIAILLMITAWFALVVQYYLLLKNRSLPVAETTIQFFSYFTILTNGLAAVYFTSQSFYPGKKSFFSKAGILTAITVYITVVGLVYQLTLRSLWDPQGLQMLVDELLHSVIPAGVILFWYFYEEK